MTYLEWIEQATVRLVESDCPKRDAEILLEYVTNKSRTFLMAFSETKLTEKQQQQLDDYLQRRQAGEPVAYIIGCKEFWSLMLKVSKDTLIPRPDTERLVETAINYLPPTPCEVLDLGTGTGAIALAIASERPDCLVTGVDRIKSAVLLAKNNADRLSIDNVHFLQSDWFKSLKRRQFAMIVSNPPYIDATDHHLGQGDLRYEPRSALVASDHGLSDIIRIVSEAPTHLVQYGWLLIEHGWDQGAIVRDIFEKHEFKLVQTINDYGGHERVTLGRWLSSST